MRSCLSLESDESLESLESQHLSLPCHVPAAPPWVSEPLGLTGTQAQGDLLRRDLRDVQVVLAGALAAQRDVLHHAAAAARVFDGTRAAVRDEVLQEVAPRRDGPGAAKLLRGERWAKGKEEGEISALRLCGCAGVCSK